ncbi:hypothetical protein D3C72_1696580 [compost metagenome]
MLNLQARVDLKKVKAVTRRVVDEFNGAGRAVVHRLAQLHGRRQQGRACRGRQQRRGRFLDHFLIAPLHRAIAFAQRQHAARAVAKDLHFHVARVIHIAFDERAAITEEVFAHALHAVERHRQFRFVLATR